MKKYFLLVLFLAMIFAFSDCQKMIDENENITSSKITTLTVIPTIKPTPDLSNGKQYSSIKDVDFKNFTYSYPRNDSDTFTLKTGIKKQIREQNEDGAKLEKIEYGDVTNDGKDEAMIGIYPLMDGNCQCETVYIYTLENKKPRLLWSFDTYDKAIGGFKRAYAENGDLIIETFGDSKFEDGKWKFNSPKNKFKGYCCPTAYTKIRFKWNGEKFVASGNPELFDYDWNKHSAEYQ